MYVSWILHDTKSPHTVLPMYTWVFSELSSLTTITSFLFAFVLESHSLLSTIDHDGRQANYLHTTFYAELQLLSPLAKWDFWTAVSCSNAAAVSSNLTYGSGKGGPAGCMSDCKFTLRRNRRKNSEKILHNVVCRYLKYGLKFLYETEQLFFL
jgi:hypothetical protein